MKTHTPSFSASKRRSVTQLAALLAAAGSPLLGSTAWAQAGKTLKIVVPFGAGGIADLTARTVAAKMAEILGQSIII